MDVVLGILGMTLSLGVGATSIKNFDEVRQVKDKYTQDLFSVAGVNGVGITLCDVETGLVDVSLNSTAEKIFCIIVYTEVDGAINLLEAKYGLAPSLLEGVILNYRKIGIIVPQPGVTIGNY